MSNAINRDTIIAYLSNLNPSEITEVAKTSGDIRQITQALILLIERLNQNRKVKLLQSELAKLRTELDAISVQIEQTKSLNDEHHRLNSQRESLLAEKEILEDLNKQKTEIEQLNALLAKYDIPTLQCQIENMRINLNESIGPVNSLLDEFYNFFTQIHLDFTTETQGLISKVTNQRKEIDTILNDANTTISLGQLHLSKTLLGYTMEFRETSIKYNSLVEQLNTIISQLREIRRNHSRNVTIYELHFAQDKSIFGELGKRHNIETLVTSLSEEIGKKMKEFDKERKTLVEGGDNITIF